MPRFPIVSRDAVPKDQVDAFDAIVSSRGGVVPEFGPVAVQLHVLGRSGINVTRASVMHLNPDFRHPDLGDRFCTSDVTD